MGVDNPSYFSIAGNAVLPEGIENNSSVAGKQSNYGFGAFFRNKKNKMTTNASTTTTTAIVSNSNGRNINNCARRTNNRSNESIEARKPMSTRTINTSTNNQRTSFRSLLMSMNEPTDEIRKLLRGEPRASDMAPPSSFMPHRSHSHSDHDRRRPQTRRILKSASELLSNDMVFCKVPGNSSSKMKATNDDENCEVFLGTDDARYYNISATLPAPGTSGARRHSVGTFIDREGGFPRRRIIQTGGFIKEPEGFAPPIPTDQVDGAIKKTPNSTKKCKKHRNTTSSCSRRRAGMGDQQNSSNNASTMEDRDDVMFISSRDSQASTLWVNYLKNCFIKVCKQHSLPLLKVSHITIEDPMSITESMQIRIAESRLQIVIICPVLLERATSKPEQASALTQQLTPERVLAMLLGVHDGHITEIQRNAFITYAEWEKFFVRDRDEEFVGEFLTAAFNILRAIPPNAVRSDKITFFVHPRKVKIGSSRLLIIMNEPLNEEDNVQIIVDRCSEAIEVTNIKRRNPYTLQFSMPDKCLEVSVIVNVRLILNGEPQGQRLIKCESRLRELDEILRARDNPLQFLCQASGFPLRNKADREKLDTWVANSFQRNKPPHFELLANPPGAALPQRDTTSPDQFPTLLHFAAHFGLEKLAWLLLECPGADLACDLKNYRGYTPIEMAFKAGHKNLVYIIRDHIQMNELSNVISYIKGFGGEGRAGAANNSAAPLTHFNSFDTDNDKEDYCRPRPLSEAYLVPPAARPVTTSPSTPTSTTSFNSADMNYSIVPPPMPISGIPPATSTQSDLNGLAQPLHGYLKMQPASPKVTNTLPAPITAPLMALNPTNSNQQAKKDERTDSQTGSLKRSTSNQGAKSREPSGPQDELLEIINDFKNNVFTISEVERLVENWRNRNDVQQSFKEKQKQLAAMRDEYERIQKKMKEDLKAPTPFDKIKKFFSKTKKESKDTPVAEEEGASGSKTDKTTATTADGRPISSLSLHSVSSTSSSGRISVISGCSGASVPDNGMPSDTDERRLRNSREDKGGMIYEVPPAPKPFNGRNSPVRYTPPPPPRASGSTTENENKKPLPINNGSDNEDFYVACPVSGIPLDEFSARCNLIDPKKSSPTRKNSKNIPEEEIDYKTETEGINRLPVPPMPPASPTHVFLEYMNIGPINILSNSHKATINEQLQDDNEAVEMSSDEGKVLNEEPAEISNEETKIINQPMEEETEENLTKSNHVLDENMSLGAVEKPKLHEYMNISVSDQEPKIVGTIPKKQAAPPVPPRAPNKK